MQRISASTTNDETSAYFEGGGDMNGMPGMEGIFGKEPGIEEGSGGKETLGTVGTVGMDGWVGIGWEWWHCSWFWKGRHVWEGRN